MSLRQLSKALADHIEPLVDGHERQQKLALKRLKNWSIQQWFRDMAWEAAVVKADQDSGSILRGLTEKAKRGRVDAAKMVMGVAGRYEEKGFAQAAQVNVVIEGVPRPQTRPAIESQVTAEEWADEA
jgi:hypothetical protein